MLRTSLGKIKNILYTNNELSENEIKKTIPFTTASKAINA